ncbi:putative metallopeptidase [Burkholderia pyrrocinia]|uniref:putative metallopeptidase n=1 Tax=Burkholderia pyrrocinia TaxID=60550 RepID=UPI00201B847B|nr:putative metallopeptidase [Burkholderia pyrrocinia]
MNWISRIVPADGVADWVTETFLRDGAPLHNEDHAHLIDADVAYLWAAVENVRQMRRVVGQREEVMIRAGGWQRARHEQQLCEWFGRVPAFSSSAICAFRRSSVPGKPSCQSKSVS